MKATLHKNVLSEALAVVKRVAAGRSTLPILQQVRLEVLPGEMNFTCTNLDQELQVTLNMGVKTQGEEIDGKLCVRAGLFHDIVKSLPEVGSSCEVVLKSAASGKELAIAAQESVYVLGALPVEEFPSATVMAEADIYTVSQGNLLGLISGTSSAMCDDVVRYVLCGALLELDGDALKCAATDGRRLAVADRPANEENRGRRKVILPRAAVEILLALLSTDDEATVEMEVTDKAARLTWALNPAASIRFTTKLVDGAYPNYQAILDMAQGHRPCAVGRPELLAAVERVRLVNKVIDLMFNGTRLSLWAKNADLPATAEEVLPCEPAKRVRIRLNSDYLVDALKAVAGPQIVFGLLDGESAVTLSTTEGHWKTLIMPMRPGEAPEETAEEETSNNQHPTSDIQPAKGEGEGENDEDGGTSNNQHPTANNQQPAGDAAEVKEKVKARKKRKETADSPKATPEDNGETSNSQHPTSNIQQAESEDEGEEEGEKFNGKAAALSDEDEALVQKAINAVAENNKCSLSLVQRWLRLPYSKANDLITILQERGIVGPTVKTGKDAGLQPVLIQPK